MGKAWLSAKIHAQKNKEAVKGYPTKSKSGFEVVSGVEQEETGQKIGLMKIRREQRDFTFPRFRESHSAQNSALVESSFFALYGQQ